MRKGRVEAGGPNCLRSFKHRLLCGGFVRQLLDLVEEKRVRMGLKLFFAVFYHDGVMNTVADSRVRLVSPGNGRRRLLLPSKLWFFWVVFFRLGVGTKMSINLDVIIYEIITEQSVQ